MNGEMSGELGAIQREASALADPTRLRIQQLLIDADVALDIAALTNATGIHHNSVRRHLTRLVDAGLAVESAERRASPGRPRLTYTASHRSQERWGAAGPYERLSLLLSEIITTGDDAAEVGRRAALRERLGARSSDAPVDELVESMDRHGFDPSVDQDGERITVTLRRCPFERAALADPDTICRLHLGLATGVAERAGHLVIDELVPRDPRHAHCELHAHSAPDTP